LSLRDKPYSDLMRELWGSPDIWNTKKSYIQIAAKLGVDEETVRNRVKHLRDIGFLLGYRLVPNPILLGRSFASLRVEFPDRETKQAAIPRLTQLDGVINIGSTYDRSALVTLLASQDQDFSKLIVGMGVEGEVSWVPGLGLRTTSFRMTRLDWEIVRLLLRDAERKPDEIANQLRVSTRTVKRRLSMMMKEAAIFTMPMVDLRKTEGISYQLRVQSEQGKKSEVEKSVAAKICNLIFRASDSQNGSVFGFTGANVAEGNDILEWVKQQPGVKSASMTIAERVVQVFDWIESEVERRISTMPIHEPSAARRTRETIGIQQLGG
jgi:DNA-binding Lrp family transcriptional regulator